MNIILRRWPQGVSGLARSAKHLSDDYQLLNLLIKKESSDWLRAEGPKTYMGPLSALRKVPSAGTLAFHVLRPFGFDYDTIQLMIMKEHMSGKQFKSNSCEALIDRDFLVIRPATAIHPVAIRIVREGTFRVEGHLLNIEVVDQPDISNISDVEYIDHQKIRWPLLLRNWKEGDYIRPLGMNGKKKSVSDILIDQKVNLFQKKEQWVLADANGEIIWVIGRKLSESFKYNPDSESLLKLEWIP